MDVIINELSSTVEVASQETLLDAVVLRQVVRAVAAYLEREEATRRWEAAERRPWSGDGR